MSSELLPWCTLCALQIYCSYAQQTPPSAINTYKNANKTFTNVLKYVHECQHAAGNVSQETWGDWGLGEAEAVTESRDQRKPSSQRHKAESAKVMILMMMSQSGLFIEITTLRPTQF